MATEESAIRYVGRGGQKLAAALDAFGIDPQERVCADLGTNVGGFTDCLLKRGAAKVYAVDTGYGTLDYSLRKDPRVVVMERTNALHVRLPELVDLIVIDLGWTRQELILPHARELLAPEGRIISLVKPHYEAPKHLLKKGILEPETAEGIFQKVLAEIPSWGLTARQWIRSPIVGSGGNVEFLVALDRISK